MRARQPGTSAIDHIVSNRQNGYVKAIYPGDCDGDPQAVPGIRPATDSDADVTSFTLEVDGEMFTLRPDEHGGSEQFSVLRKYV